MMMEVKEHYCRCGQMHLCPGAPDPGPPPTAPEGGYRTSVGQWHEHRTLPVDSRSDWVSTHLLYRDYLSWCEEQGTSPWGRRGFRRTLSARGVKFGKSSIIVANVKLRDS